MSFWNNKGADDKSQNKGQADPNKFTNHKDRTDYQTGWHQQKQREDEARRQQQDKNKK